MDEYNSIISNGNIINLISKIHEYKGKQSYLLEPKNRNEEEIAGYRDILFLIHDNYNFIDNNNNNTILQLHRDLYKYTGYNYGGKFKNYNDLVKSDACCLLVLIPIFILDFVSIHPFNDGNGQMSRLLTLLLLYKANYFVGKYISIEKIIEDTKDSYYDTLLKSSVNWHSNKNDYSILLNII